MCIENSRPEDDYTYVVRAETLNVNRDGRLHGKGQAIAVGI